MRLGAEHSLSFSSYFPPSESIRVSVRYGAQSESTRVFVRLRADTSPVLLLLS
ncbi:MAG: hypothetical protein ACK55Z_30485 [bacterium]